MRVVIAPTRVANFPDGGGHFWVYMQYVQGFIQSGCEVYWLEKLEPTGDASRDAELLLLLRHRLALFGLEERLFVYVEAGPTHRFVNVTQAHGDAICRDADLLLDFRYDTRPEMLALFERTALVDIDPGLLQLWMHRGQIAVSPHDVYFTIGETVGKGDSGIPDCGLPWRHIRPPVCLDLWPVVSATSGAAFTTVSGWSGEEWVQDGAHLYENTKRVTFLRFLDLPRRTAPPLELALDLGPGDPDASDREALEQHGWRVRQAREVASTPEAYRAYIQSSRGEFGAAKPFHLLHRTAWVSDRTVCYLASGKPVVVADTGPSPTIPSGAGLHRITTVEEAAAAIATIEAHYAQHCQAARELAADLFDARMIAATILDAAAQNH